MRKKDDTLQAALLAHARTLMNEQGAEAINIRALAKLSGVSVGTVYNYFASKEDILLALTEEYWQVTLREMEGAIPNGSFLAQMEAIYAYLRDRMNDSARTLMSSLGSVETAGQQRMHAMQQVLRAAVIRRMSMDPAIPSGLWQNAFTQQAYADFVIMNLMMQLRADAPDIKFFLEIMNKTLYGTKGA